MVKNDLKSLLLQEKPVKVLLTLKKENKPLYPAIISKKIDSTYAHTLNVIFKLNELKLVSFDEIGRVKFVKLTELGIETADIIENLFYMAKLSELELELERLFEREIKGRLREQMDKNAISKYLTSIRGELTNLIAEKPQKIQELAKKLLKKVDDIWAEATGLRPG